MIKFVLKIFNLNGRSLQIRSKQMTSGASIKQCGMSFELSEFQPGTIRQTSNSRVQKPHICIVNHDHSAVITWLCTRIIMRVSKRSNFKKTPSSSRFNFLFSRKTLQSNLSLLHKAFSSSTTLKERLSGDRSSLTSESESEMCHEDLPIRQSLEKSPGLPLTFSSSSELEESSLEKSRSLRVAHAWDIIF
jgi:hypothetical protein